MHARVVLGVGKGVLFREVSSVQECPHREREVPLYFPHICTQVVYQWLKREGHDTRGHVLITPHPRHLLDDRGRTLQQYGITMDTKLILEELVD